MLHGRVHYLAPYVHTTSAQLKGQEARQGDRRRRHQSAPSHLLIRVYFLPQQPIAHYSPVVPFFLSSLCSSGPLHLPLLLQLLLLRRRRRRQRRRQRWRLFRWKSRKRKKKEIVALMRRSMLPPLQPIAESRSLLLLFLPFFLHLPLHSPSYPVFQNCYD